MPASFTPNTPKIRAPYVGTKYALEGILDCLRYEMSSFGVSVSILEPGNFIAGTNIFNEKFVKAQADLMWNAMDDEVKNVYGKEYFDKKVEVMRSYMNNGISDISPVIDSYTDALLDMYPQVKHINIEPSIILLCFVGKIPTHGCLLQNQMFYCYSSARNRL